MRAANRNVNGNRAGRAAIIALLALAAATLGAMVLAQGPPEADAKKKKKKPTPKVLCWEGFPPDYTVPGQPPPRVQRKPDGCIFFRLREPDDCPSCFGRIRVGNIDWKLWEPGFATGRADREVPMGDPLSERVGIKLIKPVRGDGCRGRQIFSVLKLGRPAKGKKGVRGPGVSRFKLYTTC